MSDPYQLQRFVDAQGPVFDGVRAELAAGEKTGHWMWFVFPQLGELGRSGMARYYGITSVSEAKAYAEHPLLGQRLRECVSQLLAVPDKAAYDILGAPDDLKLRSSLTLFARAVPDEPLFERALQRFFDGKPDPLTLALLRD